MSSSIGEKFFKTDYMEECKLIARLLVVSKEEEKKDAGIETREKKRERDSAELVGM